MTPQPKKSLRVHSQTAMMMALDAIIVNVGVMLALQLRFDMEVPARFMAQYQRLWLVITLIHLLCFTLTHMYRSLWRYASIDELVQIVLGTGLGMGGSFAFSVVANMIHAGPNLYMLPRTVYPIAWLLILAMVGATRFSVRFVRRMGVSRRALPRDRRRRVMVVGAGWAGSSAIREMLARGYRDGEPVLVVDDDPSKAGTHINRIPVKYGVVNIPEYVERYGIDEIVIAIPSAPPAQMKPILEACTATNCRLKMVPKLREVSGSQCAVGPIRDVNITDLLYRDEVKLNMASISSYLEDRVVLVTGGGGSIGSELCRQIAHFHPSLLVVFDIYENDAYELYKELKGKYGDALSMKVLIGSVRDERRLRDVFEQYRPHTVFHAAAHKHVPLMEDSPAEAIKNNVFGTFNVARCADEFGVERFVLLSTDKAVNPTNVMGATKRVTELIIQYMAKRSSTRFMAVRFGNVLGSHGSVIPLFKQQIAAGGPVTVTHPDITRYFMTIPEASQLVLQAAAIGDSGSIFVLDMGTPVKIVDLAKNLIRLSGYTPDVDIKITFTGLRPGEKMYEELIMGEEKVAMEKTCHEKIFVAHPLDVDPATFEQQLHELRQAAEQRPELAEEMLHRVVPNYHRVDPALEQRVG